MRVKKDSAEILRRLIKHAGYREAAKNDRATRLVAGAESLLALAALAKVPGPLETVAWLEAFQGCCYVIYVCVYDASDLAATASDPC